jgi:4-hydroxybenzoyl-CoA reductase alpha subunit
MNNILLSLSVNGETHTRAVRPQITLLEFLRYELRLTGSKQGCDKGDCGACTVLVDGQAQLSCLTLAQQAQGSEIKTIEGLSLGNALHPVQDAFDRCGALQCGFCQPGMMLSAAQLLEQKPNATLDEIRHALSGNLCRCTGYTKIYEAVACAIAEVSGAKQPEPTPALGARMRKTEGRAKANGSLLYADDIQLPRMLYGRLLRSTRAHAKILKIDTAPALALPGVHAVLLGDEIPTKYGIIPWTRDEQALCTDKVRFIGDAIAAVAASDEATAEAALRAIVVEYEDLPALLTPEEALAPGAPKIHEDNKKGNVSKHVRLEFGDVDGALQQAAVLEEGEYFFEGTTHAPIEPHCALASYAPDGKLTLWSSTQIPHYLHRDLARVLCMEEKDIRVIQPALGGAFGGKSDPFALEFCAAALARKTGRPVKILYTREEVFYAHRGRHPMKIKLRLGANQEGKLTGLDSTILIDGGAYSSFGLVTSYYAGQLLTGPTTFETYRFDATRAYTNKPCCGPKRGHGSVQPRFAFEVALDKLAHKLRVDPIELRRRNDLGPQKTTVNGQTVTSNGFLDCLKLVEDASGWKERYGKLPFGRGLGVAGSMYISGTNYPIYPNAMPQSGVQVQLDRSGRVTIFCGASDIGQGSDSMMAYVLSHELGCDPRDVRVVSADTDLTPVDLGAYSSRGTMMVGNAARDAGQKLAVLLKKAVGAAWGVVPERIELREGAARLPEEPGVHDAKQMPLREVFQRAEALFGTLGATGSYNTPLRGGPYRGGTIGASPAYSFTAHVVDLSVNPSSGEVEVHKVWVAHDCGKALNPTLVEGQIEGSVYMGFGEAVMEQHAFYEKTGPARGLHLGPSLLDYRIPTSLDTPLLEAKIVESIDPEGPYGAKEAGEGPLHPVIPAIANAIFDAVGVRVDTLPFTPGKILALMRQAREAARREVAQ